MIRFTLDWWQCILVIIAGSAGAGFVQGFARAFGQDAGLIARRRRNRR